MKTEVRIKEIQGIRNKQYYIIIKEKEKEVVINIRQKIYESIKQLISSQGA